MAVTIAVGCGPGKESTTSSASEDNLATDASSTSTTTLASTTTLPSTDPSGTMSGSQAMGETTDTTGIDTGTTTEVTTGSTDTNGGSTWGPTGGGPPDLPGGCLRVCERIIIECTIADSGTVAECTDTCVADIGVGTGCDEAAQTFLDCLAGLDCVALTDAITEGNFGTCMDETDAMNKVCF